MYPNLYERVQISVQTEESWLQQISKQQPSEYLSFFCWRAGEQWIETGQSTSEEG